MRFRVVVALLAVTVPFGCKLKPAKDAKDAQDAHVSSPTERPYTRTSRFSDMNVLVIVLKLPPMKGGDTSNCVWESNPDMRGFCKGDYSEIKNPEILGLAKGVSDSSCNRLRDADLRTYCKYSWSGEPNAAGCDPIKDPGVKSECVGVNEKFARIKVVAERMALEAKQSGGGGHESGSRESSEPKKGPKRSCKPNGAETEDNGGSECCSGIAHPKKTPCVGSGCSLSLCSPP